MAPKRVSSSFLECFQLPLEALRSGAAEDHAAMSRLPIDLAGAGVSLLRPSASAPGFHGATTNRKDARGKRDSNSQRQLNDRAKAADLHVAVKLLI